MAALCCVQESLHEKADQDHGVGFAGAVSAAGRRALSACPHDAGLAARAVAATAGSRPWQPGLRSRLAGSGFGSVGPHCSRSCQLALAFGTLAANGVEPWLAGSACAPASQPARLAYFGPKPDRSRRAVRTFASFVADRATARAIAAALAQSGSGR